MPAALPPEERRRVRSFRLPPDLERAARASAAEHGVTFSALLEDALRARLESQEDAA